MEFKSVKQCVNTVKQNWHGKRVSVLPTSIVTTTNIRPNMSLLVDLKPNYNLVLLLVSVLLHLAHGHIWRKKLVNEC